MGDSEPPESSAPAVVPKKILPFSLAVASQEDRVYLSRGRELLAFQLGTDLKPHLKGRVTLGGEVRDIDVSGNYAYAAVLGSGLEIVDGRDPGRLHTVGRIDLPLAEGVDVAAGKAYVACREDGIVAVDVASPDQPVEIGRYKTQEGALKIAIAGRLAYVAASYAGMRILDIQDPARISEVGFATRGSYGQGSAWGIAVSGNRAYSAIPDNGLRQVDVSDAANAETLSIYRSLYAPVAVALQGRHAFVADQNDGLVVLDLSGDFMREVSRLDFDDSVTDVALSGSHAFLALKRTGLAVIDIAVPLRPSRIAQVQVQD